jgi:transcription-repair coupling factor (superfamily II helicase)
VVEETEALLRDATIRELARGGQVYVLYNRVGSIDSFAKRFMELVPEAAVTVAHGQLSERALEDRIMSFFSGQKNVLISTTIIENGIDLPNANTLIVIDSDRLGLSQLYQLKGRVGRSNRLAHAYFTFNQDKVLTETAYKRLSAIMDFTEMNSGYKIAMRDLEIRGAGNVLGAEQHGHMDKIGYELYAKLIKEAITGEEESETSLDLRVSAFIPESYIEGSAGRMDAYKQIAEIRRGEDFVRVKDSLTDLYGTPPKEVENLLKIAVLKARAKRFAISELYIKGGGAD